MSGDELRRLSEAGTEPWPEILAQVDFRERIGRRA
jgi:hypothetical protein